MPEKRVDTGPLEKLKSFQLEEPTGIPDLPDLPDPDAPEFKSGEVGRGIQIARAVSILLAGASDPNLAAALSQQFQQQDLLAREDAQNRYKSALGRVESEREEIGFQEAQREKGFQRQIDTAGIQLRAIQTALDAAQLEFQLTQDPAKKEQLPTTIAELEKLHAALTPESGKPIQVKSPLELATLIPIDELSRATAEGRGEQLVAEFNARQLAQPKPKGLLSQSAYESLLQSTDPVGQQYVQAMFSVAPDPRTETFATPDDKMIYGSALRQLASHDPEAYQKVADQTAQAWVAMGAVSDIETALDIFSDAVANNSDPKEDPRLGEPGQFKVTPMGPPTLSPLGKAKEFLTKPILSEEKQKKIQKVTNVQGKQQFRR